MDNHIFAFLFFWMLQLRKGSAAVGMGHSPILAVVRLANEVIEGHNAAVRKVREERSRVHWHNTGSYSDNQCVFSSMLRKDTTYQPIDIEMVKEAIGLVPASDKSYYVG